MPAGPESESETTATTRFGVQGQEDELGVDAQGFEALHRLQAGHARHAHIGDDDVRAMLLRLLDERSAVVGRGDDLDLALEQAAQALGHHDVVIGQQHARSLHHCHRRE